MNEKLCKLIKEARKENKLKQSEVAAMLGLSDGSISNWENGKADPDIDTFVKLCQIYKKNFAELLTLAYGETDKPKQKVDCSDDEVELLAMYRELNDADKNIVHATTKATFDAKVSAAKKNNLSELA